MWTGNHWYMKMISCLLWYFHICFVPGNNLTHIEKSVDIFYTFEERKQSNIDEIQIQIYWFRVQILYSMKYELEFSLCKEKGNIKAQVFVSQSSDEQQSKLMWSEVSLDGLTQIQQDELIKGERMNSLGHGVYWKDVELTLGKRM